MIQSDLFRQFLINADDTGIEVWGFEYLLEGACLLLAAGNNQEEEFQIIASGSHSAICCSHP